MVNYDDNRRDITIETKPGPRTISRLIIKQPQISDSGNYTCRASNTEPASIYVYVSRGEFFLLPFPHTLCRPLHSTLSISRHIKQNKNSIFRQLIFDINLHIFLVLFCVFAGDNTAAMSHRNSSTTTTSSSSSSNSVATADAASIRISSILNCFFVITLVTILLVNR